MKTEPVLGKVIADENAERDAVHIAIAPVTATVRVFPGQRIKEDGNPCTTGNGVGIVDPFLEAAVFPGERFYIFLYPGTVTSLRHHWTHPSFEDVLRGERGVGPPGPTVNSDEVEEETDDEYSCAC